MRRTAGLAVAAALVGATACGTSPSAPVMHAPRPTPSLLSVIAFRGQVLVADLRTIRYTPDLRQCVTRGRTRDIGQGTRVEVHNSKGLRVAVGTLGPGHLVDGRKGPAGCVFGFNMSNAPGGSPTYTVRLGDFVTSTVRAQDVLRIRIRVP